MKRLANDKGFTLIELLIVVVIALIVMGITYYAFQFQHRSYLVEEEVTEMQQNTRSAMLMLERDIRMAGFDPTMNADVGFTNAGPTGFTFTYLADNDGLDNNGDGNFDETGEIETITYDLGDSYGDGDLDIRRNDGATAPVAENIEAVEYLYTYIADSDGIDNDGDGETDEKNPSEEGRATNVADPTTIRAVQVWILARTGRDISDRPDGNVYTTPSGVVLNGGNPFTDDDNDGKHYHRRVATATIKCRNMP